MIGDPASVSGAVPTLIKLRMALNGEHPDFMGKFGEIAGASLAIGALQPGVPQNFRFNRASPALSTRCVVCQQRRSSDRNEEAANLIPPVFFCLSSTSWTACLRRSPRNGFCNRTTLDRRARALVAASTKPDMHITLSFG